MRHTRVSANPELTVAALLTLALCVVFAFACGQNRPSDEYAAPELGTTATATDSQPVSRVKRTDQATSAAPAPESAAILRPDIAASAAERPATLLVPTPTQIPDAVMLAPYWDAKPSLDQLIFKADAIVWARPPSISGKSKTIPGEEGVAPTYRPFIEFEFELVEYLKGSGGDSVRVESPQRHTHLTESEALTASQDALSERNATYDDREAVVFLRNSDGGGAPARTYYFESANREAAFDKTYSITDGYNSWLPASEPRAAKADATTNLRADAASRKFLANPESGASDLTELTLAGLRSRIAAVETMVKKGEGIEGYEDCLGLRFAVETSMRRERQINGPYVPKRIEEGPFPSGLPAGGEFMNLWSTGGGGYSKHWAEGPDADMFSLAIVADNGEAIVPDFVKTRNQATSYGVSFRVARPLPSGRYEIREQSIAGLGMPCDFSIPELAPTWIFTFESPAGTLHEAFFDPASIGSGGDAAVGADASNGVLKPTDFTFGGAGVSLDSIKWQSQTVEMRMSPHNRLANHYADFIALDGSVSLRLDFDAAAEMGEGDSRALSWPVCAQPWRDGDLLMLRISESPSDLSGVSRDGDCVSGTVAPTPTVAPVVDMPSPTPNPRARRVRRAGAMIPEIRRTGWIWAGDARFSARTLA